MILSDCVKWPSQTLIYIYNTIVITAQAIKSLKKSTFRWSFVDIYLTVSDTSEAVPSAEKLPVRVICGASRGSPVQEHVLLLVGVPTQTRADLQSVVVVGVKPLETNRTNRAASHIPVSLAVRVVVAKDSLVQRVQEDSHRLAADVHHLQDDDDVIPRYDL